MSRVATVTSRDSEEEITVTPETVSRARSVQPHQLRRILTGDLDTILLAALRKEPQRRYGSAEQFAEDVRRSLDGLPVRALPMDKPSQVAEALPDNRQRRRNTGGNATERVIINILEELFGR